MKLDIDVAMTYRLGPERTALLTLEAARTPCQRVLDEQLVIDHARLSVIEGEWGIGQRRWARVTGDTLKLRYRAKLLVSREAVSLQDLSATPMHGLPSEQLSFLRPSRYCQSDRFEGFVEREFGPLSGGARITAILDWIAAGMSYDPAYSTCDTTMLDTFASRKGVCRDYAHLLCGLARASYIPARFVAAYGAPVDPPDFHAVVQVWLGGQWRLIDPTGMCRAEDLVLIAVGRDAADVPFMETPDEASFVAQSVRVTAA